MAPATQLGRGLAPGGTARPLAGRRLRRCSGRRLKAGRRQQTQQPLPFASLAPGGGETSSIDDNDSNSSNSRIVPASSKAHGIRRLREQWGELSQYTNVEAMEALISNPEAMSYDDKVAWLERYYGLRPLQVAGRLVKVFSLGAQVAITWILEERLPEGAKRKRGEVLRDALSSLGPVFVKVGQTLATRPDLVGDEAAQYLTQLQEKNKPFPSEQAFAIIRDEFNWKGPIAGNHLEALSRPGEETPLFEELGEEPIAAASLGQVYKGRLASPGGPGTEVAVKVMRPRVTRAIALDVHVIRLALRWLQEYWGTEAELPNISNEVGAGLFRELDYRQEAQNIEEFRHAHQFQEFLKIPTTFRDWTTQRVLCMEWVDAKRKSALSDREKLSMVKMGVDCCMAQLLQTGIIHADPHDGNMMLAKNDQLCLIDFGLVTKITIEQQEAMASAILHTLAEEWALLVEDMKIMGLLPEVPAIWVDPVTKQPVSALERGEWKEMAEEEFTAVFEASMTKSGTQRSFSQITEQLCELGASYRVNLPTWLVLIIRSMLTLDGFASAMNYNPIEAAYPHAIRRALAPVTERGVEALQAAILTPSGDVRWARLSNLLGEDDALKDAAAENKARAQQTLDEPAPASSPSPSSPSAGASDEEEPPQLHMDAAEEAKRVLTELMVSCEGKALRRLIYTANTSSILQRLLSRDILSAAVERASSVGALVQAVAQQMEAQVAHSLHALTRAFQSGSQRDLDTRKRVAKSSWRAAAVYGVLARHHVRNLLGCGPRGFAAAFGLSIAAVILGTLASAMVALNTVARIPALVRQMARRQQQQRPGGTAAGAMALSGGPPRVLSPRALSGGDPGSWDGPQRGGAAMAM